MKGIEYKKIFNHNTERLNIIPLYKINKAQENNQKNHIYNSINVVNNSEKQNNEIKSHFDDTNSHIEISSNINDNYNMKSEHNLNHFSSNHNTNNNSLTKIKNYLMSSLMINNGNNYFNNETNQMNENCLICYEKLSDNEIKNNFLGCFHGFCDDCLYNYFKEKINSNIVDGIKCPETNCKTIINNNFIEGKITKDISLLEKYKKQRKLNQLLHDPNVKLCPYPDCKSYAIKKDNNLVSCIHNGHQFCFNCLKHWHNAGRCAIKIDNYYKKWKNGKNIKRCPKCKYLIEKNEGCNHMTCSNCKYEWCWICKGKYNPHHYDFGSKCFGLQNPKCACLSNRFCAILYQIGILVLIALGIIILGPFIAFAIINYKISDYFFKIKGKIKEILFFLSVLAKYICFCVPFICVSICFLTVILFICLFNHKIFDLLKKIFR